ncbi:MAG: response regulator [Planctomycetota bacterium]
MGKHRIMYVDDEPNLLAAIARALHEKRAHWDVLLFDNASAALCEYRVRPADVVITDMLMPDMDGVEFLIAIRRLDPGARVIAVSGDDRTGLEVALPAASMLGAVKTLRKPCRSHELIAAIEEILQRE